MSMGHNIDPSLAKVDAKTIAGCLVRIMSETMHNWKAGKILTRN